MSELRFFVPGIPASQGSMICMGVNKRTGRHMVIPDNPAKLKNWRYSVMTAATNAWARADRPAPLTSAEARIIFRLTRPQNHYRTGRNAHLLRDAAPDYPTGPPDTDKLIRAIFDALTQAAVITDDAVIVTVTAAKRWVTVGQQAGCNVVLSEPPTQQPPLLALLSSQEA